MKRTAIVTGGFGGIGLAIIRQFLIDGYEVIAADIREPASLPGEYADISGKFHSVKVDVSSFDSCMKMKDELGERGFEAIDIIVNNAGITRDSLIAKMGFDQWDSVIKVDLYSMFNVTKQFVNGMIERKFGRIINTSSISREGNIGQCNYSAAKAGVVGFTKALARELARYGITSNAVSPGLVNTEILSSIPQNIMEALIKKIPAGRLARPDEVASLVSFLASENAAYISGEVININGDFMF